MEVRLFRFLNALGQEIEIAVRGVKVRKKAEGQPGIVVRGAGRQ